MKRTLQFIFGIGLLAFFALTVLLFMDGTETSQEIEYTYPTEGTYTSYEVEHVVKGYEGAQYESTDYGLTDEEKQTIFEEYNELKTYEAEYDEARDIASGDDDQTFVESEEDRIEEYCSEYGFEACYDFEYTCETEWECHLVTITCDDYDYDPAKEISWGKKYGCDSWNVVVAEEDFDIRTVDESYYESYGWME